MPTTRPRRTAVAFLAAALVLTNAAPATAADPVTAYLSAHPGGQRINATEIAYDNGRFIVTVTAPPTTAALAGPDCTSGWFCFYDNLNYGYPRGRLSDCGLQDLARWGWRNRTESVHYNMNAGSVYFLDDTYPVDTTLFTIGTSKRTIADVGTRRNKADLVFRYC